MNRLEEIRDKYAVKITQDDYKQMRISDIAEMLSLSVTTISTYRARVMQKMNLKTNSDLTKYAIENKLI